MFIEGGWISKCWLLFHIISTKGNSSINVAMLLVQYLFTTTIGGIFYYILKDKDKNEKNDEMT